MRHLRLGLAAALLSSGCTAAAPPRPAAPLTPAQEGPLLTIRKAPAKADAPS